MKVTKPILTNSHNMTDLMFQLYHLPVAWSDLSFLRIGDRFLNADLKAGQLFFRIHRVRNWIIQNEFGRKTSREMQEGKERWAPECCGLVV